MKCVVGIDLGIRKLAYSVFLDGELEDVGAYAAEACTRSQELADLCDYLDGVLFDLCQARKLSPVIVIEEPLVGNNAKYSMKISQAYGAVLAGTAYYERRHGARVIPAPVGTWKKQVVGNGHASKEQIRKHISEVSERYADMCDEDQDQYDATCVGIYGCLVTARADGLLERN